MRQILKTRMTPFSRVLAVATAAVAAAWRTIGEGWPAGQAATYTRTGTAVGFIISELPEGRAEALPLVTTVGEPEGNVKLPRRRFLHLAAGAAALPAVSHVASGQSYPSRLVHVIVGLPAGSATDVGTRLVGQGLSERLGQPFVIENRPGASTNIGTETVVRALADGYTLLAITSVNATNASLYRHLSFNFIRDIAPVALIGDIAFVIAINPSVPAQTVPEFIAYAKTNPGEITMASAGTGSGNHIYGVLFGMMAGVDFIHVPYRSSYMPDLLAGQVQVVFSPIAQCIEHIKTGKLRALAVTASTRSEVLPGIPTVGESVPGYEASGWQGIAAPKGTSIEIIEKLNEQIRAVLADPNMKQRLLDMGIEPRAMAPTEFGKFIADETEKWGKVIRVANIKVE